MTEPDQASARQSRVAQATARLVNEITRAEPQVTQDVTESIPPGTELAGLEYRMKSAESIAAKFTRQMSAANPRNWRPRITDALRFTAVSPTSDGVAPMARDTVSRLAQKGWQTVEAEHSYVAGNPYKGLHVLMQSPHTQQTVEVQFHSTASFALKQQMHGTYELLRDPSQPEAERAAAFDTMARAWERIPTPPSLEALKTVGTATVETKTYPPPPGAASQQVSAELAEAPAPAAVPDPLSPRPPVDGSLPSIEQLQSRAAAMGAHRPDPAPEPPRLSGQGPHL